MVKFTACLKQSGKPIKLGAEGEAEIILEASADELAEVLKLNLFRRQTFTVIFEDFDWYYLAKIMETKMHQMSIYFKKHGVVKDSDKMARELLICSELLKRLIDDDISDEKLWFVHDMRMNGWQKELGRQIGKHLRCWWD